MKKSNVLLFATVTLAAIAAPFLAVHPARAATYTWSGSYNTIWSTGSNWSSSITPGSGDEADFTSTFGNSPYVATAGTLGEIHALSSLGQNLTIGGTQTLTVTGTASGIDIDNSGYTTSFGSSTILALNSANHTWLNNNTAGLSNSAALALGGSYSLIIAGSVNTGSATGYTLTLSGSGSTLISGAITGVNSVTVNASGGLVVLTGSNTFNASTTVKSGTLGCDFFSNMKVAQPMGSGTGALTLGDSASGGSVGTLWLMPNEPNQATNRPFKMSNGANGGGVFMIDNGSSLTLSGLISGSGGLTKSGSGLLTLTATGGANTWGGGTTVSGGSLQLGAGNALPANTTLTLTAGVLDLQGYSPTVGPLGGGGGTILSNSAGSNATLTVNAALGSTTYGGVLANGSGTLALNTTGSGYLTLSGSNTYSGGTVISGGALAFSNSSAVPAQGLITIGPGGALAATTIYNPTSTSPVSDWLSNGPIAPNPAGAIALTNGTVDSETITFSGTSSSLSLGAIGSATFDGTLNSGSNGYLLGGGGGTLTVGSRLTTSTASLTVNGNVILTNANTYGGATTISAGTLQLGTGSSGQDGSLSSGTITNYGVLAYNLYNNQTYSGVIGGSGAVAKLGASTLTLTGSNIFSGLTTVSAGTLQIGNGGGVGTLGTGNVSVAANAALVFNRNDNYGGNFANVISGSGSVTLLGGNLTVTSVNPLSGPLSVAGGTLNISGSGSFASFSSLGVSSGAMLLLSQTGSNPLAASSATWTVAGGTINNIGYPGATWPATLPSAVKLQNGTLTGSAGGFGYGDYFVNYAVTVTASGNSTISGAGGVAINNQTLTLSTPLATDQLAVSAPILNYNTGIGSLTKTGTGTVMLSGASTYTGATTVSGGILSYQSSLALGGGSATTVSSGATVQFQNGVSGGTQPTSINGAGAAAAGATGALENVSGANSYGGLITLAGNATIASDAGSLSLTNTGTITGAKALTLAGAGNGSIASAIGTGAGTLIVNGPGTWILSGASTYTGNTTISGGTLQVGNGTSGNLGNTAVTVNNSGCFNAATINALNGSASLAVNGAAAVANLSVANSFSGATTVSNGILLLSDPGALASSPLTLGGGTLQLRYDTNGTTFSTSGGSVNITASSGIDVDRFSSSGNSGHTLNLGNISINTANNITVTFTNGGGNNYSLSVGTVSEFSNNPTFTNNMSSGTLTLAALVDTVQGANENATFNGTNSSAFTSVGAISQASTGAKALSLIQSGSGTLLLTGANTYTGATTVSAGTLQVGNSTGGYLNSSAVMVQSNGNLTEGMVNALTNNASLTVNGAAAMANLSFANNYNGTTTLTSGILLLSDTGAVASSTLALNGGTLQLRNNTLDAGFAASGGVTVAGNPVIDVDRSSASGGTGNTLALGAIGSIATTDVVTFTNNTSSGTADYNLLLGSVTAAGSATFTNNMSYGTATLTSLYESAAGNKPVIFNGTSATAVTSVGPVTQNGAHNLSLIQSGSGTLALTGSNSYTGATTLTSGVLLLSNTAAVGSSPLALNGGTLQLRNDTNNALFVSSGAVAVGGNVAIDVDQASSGSSGSTLKLGNLSIADGNTITLTNNGGADNYNLSVGTVTSAASPTFTNNMVNGTTAMAALTVTTTNGAQTVTFNGSSGIAVTSVGAITQNGSNPLGLVQSGGGVLLLSASNGYTGGTTLSGGTLQLGNAAALGAATAPLTISSGILDVQGYSVTVGSLSGGGMIFSSSAGGTPTLTVNIASGATTYSGALAGGSGTLGLDKTGGGLLALAGSNTYAGATTVNAGTLAYGTDNSIPFGSAAGNVSVNSSGILDLAGHTANVNGLSGSGTIDNSAGAGKLIVGNNNATTTFSGVIQNTAGTLALTKTGGGTLTLGGANTYTGTTTISSGMLVLSGSLGNTAVTVGSGGTLAGGGNNSTIGGSMVVNGGGALILPLGDSTKSLTLANGLNLGGVGAAYNAANYATLNYALGGSGIQAIGLGSGAVALNAGGAFVNVTGMPISGTYTLMNFGSQSFSGSNQFSLSPITANVTTENVGRSTYTLQDSATSSLQLQVVVTFPGVAYFNGAVSNIWSDLTNPTYVNWSSNKAGTVDAGNIPNANTDVILTADSQSGTVTTVLGANMTINSLNVNATAASNTINADGSTLTINALADSNTSSSGYGGNPGGNGIAVAAGAGAVTINVPLVLGGSQAWTNASGNLLTLTGSIAGTAAANNTETLTLVNSGTGGTTIGGSIGDGSWGGSLAVAVDSSGAGITTLSGSNTYSGGTTLTAGNLALGNSSGLGSGPLTVNGGQLDLGGLSTTIKVLNGSGGTLTNSGASDTLTLNSGSYGGSINNGSGTIALLKAGTGLLAMSGSSNYTGGTTISGGTLSITGDTALGSTAGGLIFSGASTLQAAGNVSLDPNRNTTINATATVNTQGYNMTIAGAVNGSSGLVKTGAGMLTLSGSDAYGATTVNAGTLAIGATGVVDVANGALTINGSNAVMNVQGAYNKTSNSLGQVENGGVLNVFGNVLWSGIVSPAGLRIGAAGAGTANISGGSMTVSLGAGNAMNIGYGDGDSGVVNVTNGLLALTGTAGLTVGSNGASSGTLNINNGGVLQFNSAGGFGLANGTAATVGVINLNSGGLLQTNKAITNGLGTGTFYFNGGTLQATASSANLLQNLSDAYVQDGGAFIDDGGNTITIGQSLLQGTDSGTGGLTKLGDGTLVLSGTNTYAGGTNVLSGELILDNSEALLDGSSLTVGDPGDGGGFVLDRSLAGSSLVAASPAASSPAGSVSLAAVPEPGTLALLAAGLVIGIGAAWRRRKRL